MPSSNSRRLLVEGWRFCPHSYATVNQFQLLEMLRRGWELRHHESPYYRPHWPTVDGLYAPGDEDRLRNIEEPTLDQTFDAAYRIQYPFDLSPMPRTLRTGVFVAAEYGRISNSCFGGAHSLGEIRENVTLITPSHWSAKAFIHGGADAGQVVVVPHGVDVNIFKPVPPDARDQLRRRLGLDGFVFLNVGAMTQNKGAEILLKAFAIVSLTHPHAMLFLKGLDELYPSKKMLEYAMRQLPQSDFARIEPRLRYDGRVLSVAKLASLYQLADAYVTPYNAEGFNLPVLEAIACGLPVISTAGGVTDEFVNDQLALRIHSVQAMAPPEVGYEGFIRVPSLEHLVELMKKAIEDPAISLRARSIGPAFVSDNFTWRHAVDRLEQALFPNPLN